MLFCVPRKVNSKQVEDTYRHRTCIFFLREWKGLVSLLTYIRFFFGIRVLGECHGTEKGPRSLAIISTHAS